MANPLKSAARKIAQEYKEEKSITADHVLELIKAIDDVDTCNKEEADRYRERARETWASDECEIDENATVSISENGAFVQAWIYVEKEEI